MTSGPDTGNDSSTRVTSAFDSLVSINERDVDALCSVSPADVAAAPALTFCRNVFVPLTTACRYTCSYCTYYDDPGEATLMDPEQVRQVLRRGARAGCTEALFTFGDAPDARYTEVYAQLAEWDHDSILSYLGAACEIALEEGLLPHSNPGDLTYDEMARASDLNASMGVMLETTADVPAHSGPRKKTPTQRLRTIENAGRLRVPFTTGILVGIGESRRDRAHSLLSIRALHEEYGHVQEVIVQPVVENERWRAPGPDLATFRHAVAMARYALPEEVSVQVPPNLAPVEEVIDCGIDDLGGVSPVTDDYINPEHAWPAVRELGELAERAGVPLRERLPVYERFVPDELTNVPDVPGVTDTTAIVDTTELAETTEIVDTTDTTEIASDRTASTAATDDEWLSERIARALTAGNTAGERYRAVLCGTANGSHT